MARRRFYSNLDRQATFRRLRRPANARVPFDAGSFVGAVDQRHLRSRGSFHRLVADGDSNVSRRDRHPNYFPWSGDLSPTSGRSLRKTVCYVQISVDDGRRGDAPGGAGTVQSNAWTRVQSRIGSADHTVWTLAAPDEFR